MAYSFMGALEVAKYHFIRGEQGYCYDMCTNFINNHNLTKEQLENIFSPALETFLVVTPEMKKAKSEFEETTRAQIEMKKKQSEHGRGMAA